MWLLLPLAIHKSALQSRECRSLSAQGTARHTLSYLASYWQPETQPQAAAGGLVHSSKCTSLVTRSTEEYPPVDWSVPPAHSPILSAVCGNEFRTLSAHHYTYASKQQNESGISNDAKLDRRKRFLSFVGDHGVTHCEGWHRDDHELTKLTMLRL